MNKSPKVSLLIIFILSLCLALDNASSGFINHVVKKGESVSLICIDYYGYYSSQLGKAFQNDNPGVKDINIIITGQTLRFRTPRARAAAKPAASSPAAPLAADDSLFVKKVAARQGVVTCVEGQASVTRKGTTKSEPLGVNTLVNPGDRINTLANGRVEVIINRETVVRLREKTSLNLEAYRNPAGTRGKTRVKFSAGAVWTKMKKFQDKFSRYELELPNAVAGVHGTVYQAAINPDQSSEVKVFSGEVAVEGKSPGSLRQGRSKNAHEVSGPSEVAGPSEVDLETWIRIVKSMQKIAIDKNGNASAARPFSQDTANSWEQWNRERDQRIQEIFGEQ